MVKNQHYVSRFYLRKWADGKNEIWVYDKARDLIFQENIKNVAYEEYFYDAPRLEKALGQVQFVETALGRLESDTARVLDGLLGKLNSNNFTRLHAHERQHLALFMAVQMLRTKGQRVFMQQASDMLSKRLHEYLTPEMKAAAPEQVPPLHISDGQLAELQARLITHPDSFLENAAILNSHFWTILKACAGTRFLTSDQPFARNGRLKFPFGGLGIASKGIEICFPLSPDYSLCLFERTHYAEDLKRLKHLENKLDQSRNSANMDYANQFQVRDSTRFVFAKEQVDLAFARQFCVDNPQCRDPHDERIGSSEDESPS